MNIDEKTLDSSLIGREQKGFRIYCVITIEMPIGPAGVAKKVSLINISGEISRKKSIDASAIKYEIDVTGSSLGVYFILINSDKNKFVFKIIVK